MISRVAATWLVVIILCSGAARGKERHLEQVRALLVSRTARCTSCHTDADGKTLNAYGDRLAESTAGRSLADRIVALDKEPPLNATEATEAKALADQDIDGDGVANWIEIIAETSPADADDKPGPKTAERIEAVVSCKLCHTKTNLPGEGLEAAPHNLLGKLLARTFVRQKGKRSPRGKEAIREAAERTPILARLAEIRRKRPRGSKATYWERIRLLCPPADLNESPKLKPLTAFRKLAGRQKRKRTRDPNLGLDCKAHQANGFLADAKRLP